MQRALLLVLLTCGCVGQISTPEVAPPPPRPRDGDCSSTRAPTTARVYEGLRGACVGCHGDGAEFPLFASASAFEVMVANNARFVTPGAPDTSALFAMLEGTAGALQMPPSTAYAALADVDPALPSVAELRCWVRALEPSRAPAEVSASLNRRLFAEHLHKNLEWALGVPPTAFTQTGNDYGLEDPDGLRPRSTRARLRLQQLGAPKWLDGVGRSNDIGTSFIQVTVQVSQAWCLKVNAANGTFFKHASAGDGLATPESTARVRLNLAYLFERVTGEPASVETLDGLLELFRLYDTGTPRAGWPATCAAIVRHPLSLTF